jgi:hypothetical protein
MTKTTVSAWAIGALFTGLALTTFTGCSNGSSESAEMQTKIDSMQKVLASMSDDTLQSHLTKFDTLDYVVFSGQEWERFHESHDKNIIVNWPDGHQTKGLERHIADMKALFVYAPDTRIKVHPIRFGNETGEWTCVTGIMEGTFTKPMPLGNGKFAQPTGKAFKLPMCTVGHWKNGVMIEESLYWDNQTYMSQIGMAK